MRSWVPENPPSNRDRLELYALHKQAAAGDCNTDKPVNKGVAEKAKWSAWRSKSGLSQAESMSRYIAECDRQVRVYGSKAGPSTTTVENTSDQPAPTTPSSRDNPNSPATSHSLLRGIDSVPLLASAASEPQANYMQRLAIMNTNQSWWSRQNPLCGPASPSSPTLSSKLENLLIGVGTFLEARALSNKPLGPLPPSAVHAFVFPLHVLLLTYWIILIYLLTLPTTLYLVVKTSLLGSNSTSCTLSQLIETSITPTSTVASSLMNDRKNCLPTRVIGLALTPLVIITDLTTSLYTNFGDFIASGMYVFGVIITWWYWVFVLPWVAGVMGWVGVIYGGCLSLIEVAGV
ncbi:hypothetical protein TrVE_jg12916 [Triparma verrucosa]|uniref:ACB domain-containing protein n=2 Tax=Triparma TaxID=722752 RepID=A0A9W7BBA6_9STRA|nr:hypothetical protein TrST_g608 [Triparma strigata]GMH98330.1 hypothetical protein TrVE_jg12916 [Triparma verrucosa]